MAIGSRAETLRVLNLAAGVIATFHAAPRKRPPEADHTEVSVPDVPGPFSELRPSTYFRIWAPVLTGPGSSYTRPIHFA